MNEEWRPIMGYEGIYSVSSSGRVLSCHSNKILKLRIGSSGRYQTVHLSLNGKKEDLYVHRLVAEEFIPNPNNHPYVDHIDGNTTNSDAAKSVNGDISDISRCCRGIRNKTVKGFIWRFINE